jgi:pyrimidine-nucleoside phosphorylase
MRASLEAIGCALIGQTAQVAPADKKLYALRDVTGTIESVPLISASIMSKKIAEGIGALVLDVKSGKGAFMKTPAEARVLAESLVAIGKSAGLKTQAVITAMNWPIGFAVGNANEVVECIELLKGNGRPDLVENVLELSERMLVVAGVAGDRADAAARCRRALDSGDALERLRAIIERQGGNSRVIDDYGVMPRAPREHVMRADVDGFVTELDAGLIGRAVVMLGGGRGKVDDEIDSAVGIIIPATVGDAVLPGDPVLRVHYRSAEKLEHALPLLTQAVCVGESPRSRAPLVIDEVL